MSEVGRSIWEEFRDELAAGAWRAEALGQHPLFRDSPRRNYREEQRLELSRIANALPEIQIITDYAARFTPRDWTIPT